MSHLDSSAERPGNLLRVRDGHEARVTFVELFFDLVYVFCITQLSHYLLHELSLWGALETLVLLFAVWLGWQYTCWVTNWFDPETKAIRLLLFAIMLLGLVMAAALPHAFGSGGLAFAVSYVLIQTGRTVFVLGHLGGNHVLTANFRRMLGWLLISAVFWIAGALMTGHERFFLWAMAVLCEYVSPMFGFWLPGLGRSESAKEWTIEGGHLAERCQLFMIIALGECILITGATLSVSSHLDAAQIAAFVSAFLTSLVMWWLYFDTSSKDGTEAIVHAKDQGKVGAYYHYTHVTMVAGIVLTAVSSELVIAHPHAHMTAIQVTIFSLSVCLYLLGNALYKRLVYRRFPASHLAGIAVQAALVPVFFFMDLLTAGVLGTVLLIIVAIWQDRERKPEFSAQTLSTHQ